MNPDLTAVGSSAFHAPNVGVGQIAPELALFCTREAVREYVVQKYEAAGDGPLVWFLGFCFVGLAFARVVLFTGKPESHLACTFHPCRSCLWDLKLSYLWFGIPTHHSTHRIGRDIISTGFIMTISMNSPSCDWCFFYLPFRYDETTV